MDEELRWFDVQLLANVFTDLNEIGTAGVTGACVRLMAVLDTRQMGGPLDGRWDGAWRVAAHSIRCPLQRLAVRLPSPLNRHPRFLEITRVAQA